MDRLHYARYVLARIAGTASVAGGACYFVHLLQRLGMVHPPVLWPGRAGTGIGVPLLTLLGHAQWWAWPVCWAVVAQVVLGPKQRRPIYLKIPGAMFVFAGIGVPRSSGCRGGLVTGSTGSGKTLACIVPRLHSLCVNESGIENAEWRSSSAFRQIEAAKAEHRRSLRKEDHLLGRLALARRRAQARLDTERARLSTKSRRVVEAPTGDAIGEVDLRIAAILTERALRSESLRAAADSCRRARFASAPWGGFICGEKGNEWATISELLSSHGREEDLCILQTRPPWATAQWRPTTRFNLISIPGIPADTYAQLLVDSSLSSEGSQTRDEFFVPQARDKIAWGIRLARAVENAAPLTRGTGVASLATVFDILTGKESYRQYLIECTERLPGLVQSEPFNEARFHLENNYWNQPPEQLGGVRSTLHNFLAPYVEPEIADVFCSDSTFDLRSIQLGKVVCLAIPQKHSLQRRYLSTFLKSLVYRIILERFDSGARVEEAARRSVVLVEQDEWQRNAVSADCEVDVIREAHGAVYATTQSQNAVWLKLGGKEKAAPLIANLRNRWICQAGTEECAEESSSLVGTRLAREVTYSMGEAGRTTNISYPERPNVPTRVLRNLRPFHVIFAPAEGPWIYRSCISMPATPSGQVPNWWFGNWNPFYWAAHFLRLPPIVAGVRMYAEAEPIPPWRAAAPLRAQVRWLLGFDGTCIVLGGVRSSAKSLSGEK